MSLNLRAKRPGDKGFPAEHNGYHVYDGDEDTGIIVSSLRFTGEEDEVMKEMILDSIQNDVPKYKTLNGYAVANRESNDEPAKKRTGKVRS